MKEEEEEEERKDTDNEKSFSLLRFFLLILSFLNILLDIVEDCLKLNGKIVIND